MGAPQVTTARAGALGELNLADGSGWRAYCGSSHWAGLMAAGRPYDSAAAVLAAAERSFDALSETDWREAFAAHARIGQPQDGDARGRSEQAGAARADAGMLAALRTGNAEYERRFGHVFLICASGLSAETMLAALRDRIAHEPATELRIAAAEQRRITRLRLGGLLAA